ncbi:MAG TPA: hypothetical protein VD907_05520 [Verrucomicrobiae bacterium]|nr:hypothetical protein [Verrucomicrobiae bacterium]
MALHDKLTADEMFGVLVDKAHRFVTDTDRGALGIMKFPNGKERELELLKPRTDQ